MDNCFFYCLPWIINSFLVIFYREINRFRKITFKLSVFAYLIFGIVGSVLGRPEYGASSLAAALALIGIDMTLKNNENSELD